MCDIFYIEDYQTIKSQSNNPEWKINWPTNGQTILKCPNLKVEHGIFVPDRGQNILSLSVTGVNLDEWDDVYRSNHIL